MFYFVSLKVSKKEDNVACSVACECRTDLGLDCLTTALGGATCSGSYTGSRCVCVNTDYWNGALCGSLRNKNINFCLQSN